MEHLLIECDYSNKFWQDLINWFNMIDIKVEAEKASRFSSTQSILDSCIFLLFVIYSRFNYFLF